MPRHVFAALLLCACTSTPPVSPDFGTTRIRSLLDAAAARYEQHDLAGTERLALDALAAAREVDWPTGEAHGQRLLGLARRSLEPILQARDISATTEDVEGLGLAHLAIAEVALTKGHPETALQATRAVLETLADWPDRQRSLGAAARSHHLASVALRALDRPEEAASQERAAQLTLTRLPDAALVPLRAAVSLNRAEDERADGRHREAFRAFAVASALAHEAGDVPLEVAAIRGLGRTLVSLERNQDAAAQWERALTLATRQDPRDKALVERLLREARAASLAVDEGPGTLRWERLEALIMPAHTRAGTHPRSRSHQPASCRPDHP